MLYPPPSSQDQPFAPASVPSDGVVPCSSGAQRSAWAPPHWPARPSAPTSRRLRPRVPQRASASHRQPRQHSHRLSRRRRGSAQESAGPLPRRSLAAPCRAPQRHPLRLRLRAPPAAPRSSREAPPPAAPPPQARCHRAAPRAPRRPPRRRARLRARESRRGVGGQSRPPWPALGHPACARQREQPRGRARHRVAAAANQRQPAGSPGTLRAIVRQTSERSGRRRARRAAPASPPAGRRCHARPGSVEPRFAGGRCRTPQPPRAG
mmetsp:Transcript_26800/g.68174  ORF Transcript_26800/g.68174 Transcript_26800/m.68174 type:complete len:265 (+) Transcript_26800:285-1079(+)